MQQVLASDEETLGLSITSGKIKTDVEDYTHVDGEAGTRADKVIGRTHLGNEADMKQF